LHPCFVAGVDKSNMLATQDIPVLNSFEGKFEGRQIPIEQVLQHIVEYEAREGLGVTRCKIMPGEEYWNSVKDKEGRSRV